MSSRVRADVLLVERGLMDSRSRARTAIEAGLVRAGGRLVAKPGELLPPDVALEAAEPFVWVSRAGLKLDHALAEFGLGVTGRTCLDLGASTGGFTQVLLARGAARVVAVDVGTGQLHPSLRDDPRVELREQTDARSLGPLAPAPTLVTADLSFIGLGKVLPHVLPLASAEADAVVLVKPQFEAGPQRVGRGGLVAPDVAEVVAAEVRDQLDGLAGFCARALVPSPVTGGDGNREFLLWLSRGRP